MTARAAIVGVVGLTLLGGLAYAGVLPESLRSSPEEFLASLGLDPDDPEGENGDEENGFDPAPLREGSEASENARDRDQRADRDPGLARRRVRERL